MCSIIDNYLNLFLLVATINFSQSLYVVNERNGVVNPVLILSNKSSTDITVQVVVTDFSASE